MLVMSYEHQFRIVYEIPMKSSIEQIIPAPMEFGMEGKIAPIAFAHLA